MKRSLWIGTVVVGLVLGSGLSSYGAVKNAAWLQGNTLAAGSSDLAVSEPTAISWTVVSSVDSSKFDHSFVNPTTLTLLEDGDFFVAFTAPIDLGEGTVQRATSAFELYVNGSPASGGLGQSTYLRNAGGATESSGHFAALLTGLSAGDELEVRTYRIAQPAGLTVLEMASLYVERIDDSATVFSGTATGTTGGPDLNRTEDLPDRELAWTSTRKDAGFGHSDGSHEITLESGGNYLVYVDVPMASGVARASVAIRIAVGGAPVLNAIAEQGYIRNSNAHTNSSLHWSGLLRDVSPGQTLTVDAFLRAIAGEVVVQDGKQATIFVQKVDGSEGLFSSALFDEAFEFNFETATPLIWNDANETIDSATYGRGGSHEINVRKDGSYLLVYNDNIEGGSARANPKIRVLVNGDNVVGAETKAHYIRQTGGHIASSGSLVFLLDDLSSGDVVSLTTEQEGNGGLVFGPLDDASAILTLIKKDTFVSEGGGSAEAKITRFTGNVESVTVELIDQGSPVVTDSVEFQINGNGVEVSSTKADGVTTIHHDYSILPDSGSEQSVLVSYSVESGESFSVELTYRVNEVFTRLSPDFTNEGVDRDQPGFLVNVTQLTDDADLSAHGNSLAGAELQLSGIHPVTGEAFENEANPAASEVESVINWEQSAFNPPGDNFDFANGFQNELIPGIPGTKFSDNGVAAEILTYLELDAGFHTLGVNSEDGFRLSIGRTTIDLLASTLAEFDGGRAEADTIFNIAVDQAGIYPTRLLWWAADDGASIEFFSVQDGEKILVNDSTNPNAIKAFRSGPSLPSVTGLTFPHKKIGSVIELEITDGAIGVVEGSISMTVDGESVSPEIVKQGAVTTVTFDNGDLFPGGEHTASISFQEASDPVFTRSTDIDFTIPTGIIEVLRDEPIAYWGLGESEGLVAVEEVNVKLEGIYTSLNSEASPNLGAERLAVGAPTTAALFSKDNFNLVVLPDHDAIDNLAIEDRTIELWFNAHSLPTSGIGIPGEQFTDRATLWEQGGVNRGINIYLLGTQASNPTEADLYFIASNNSAGSVWNDPPGAPGDPSLNAPFVKTTIQVNTTYHIAFVMDGDSVGLEGTITGYVNGQAIGSMGGIGRITGNHNTGVFGAFANNGAFHDGKINGTFAPTHPSDAYYFDGVIDEVAVFAEPLSADRILAHYESGNTEVPLRVQPGGDVGEFTGISIEGTQATITWNGAGTLQWAPAATGPFTDVDRASSPHTADVVSGENRFYRLRQ
ncbi:MAG TPA: LamG domain-containing protein [Verrucomicrobiales bacterium]|nr:LamG domain-containing protein [Verrucomicrobiales bacterium]